jgi:hypothetical protein
MMIPYYLSKGVSRAEFNHNRSLTTRTNRLRTARNAMVITNRNDFLLRPTDLAWLRSTFGPNRLAILPAGGHLGNLASPEVRSHIHHLLKDLH